GDHLDHVADGVRGVAQGGDVAGHVRSAADRLVGYPGGVVGGRAQTVDGVQQGPGVLQGNLGAAHDVEPLGDQLLHVAQRGRPRVGQVDELGGEEVHRADDPVHADDREADAGAHAGAGGGGRPDAVGQLADVADEDQVALPPGAPGEP